MEGGGWWLVKVKASPIVTGALVLLLGSELAGIIETGVITCGHLGGRRKIRQCRGWEPSNLAHNGHYLIRITLQAIRKM